MATNERSMEEFQAVHNIILELLRVSPAHASNQESNAVPPVCRSNQAQLSLPAPSQTVLHHGLLKLYLQPLSSGAPAGM